MTADTLLVIFVGATALAMVLQIFFIVRVARTAQRLANRVDKVSKDLEKETRRIMSQVDDVSTGLDHLRRSFDNMGERAVDISQMLEARVVDIDRLVEKLVEVGHRQADKVDEVVTDTVDKFEQTTGVLQKDILRPVMEISSLIKGLRTGLHYLFKPDKGSRSSSRAEEDLFI